MKTPSRSPPCKVAGMGMLTGIRSPHGPAMVLPSLVPRKRSFFSRRSRPGRLEWILGVLAVAGACAAYFLRRQAGRLGRTADFAWGLGEDVLVNRAGKKILA